MTEFFAPVDIGNRALQHIGQPLMTTPNGFNDGSNRARQISFAYGKLREAELRRNVWCFATKRAVLRAVDANTLILTPGMWVAGTTYFQGSIVASENNSLWISRIHQNLGNQPENSLTWEPYFGPMTVSAWSSGTSYLAGDLVYTQTGLGTARVYLSLQSGNSDNPATATAWSATVTYDQDQIVTFSSVAYISLEELNTNHQPNVSPTFWATSFVGGTGSNKWLQIGGPEFPDGVGVDKLNIIYPLGAGPSSQSSSRNIYRMPNSFLRMAPQDPKAGSMSYLGAPSGLLYDDWLVEGDYLLTADAGPIALRFVANFNDVSRMDPMFCEGLAARIAAEVCQPVTQSTALLGASWKIYKDVMDEARVANAIEIGSDEPPIDDYIACRG